MPIFEAAGHSTGFVVPLPNWASVQATRPPAAEGLRPIPTGIVTVASLSCELACLVSGSEISVGLGFSNGTSTVTAAPAGESVWAVLGSTPIDGSKGIESHSLGEVPGGILDSKYEEPLGKPGSGSW